VASNEREGDVERGETTNSIAEHEENNVKRQGSLCHAGI